MAKTMEIERICPAKINLTLAINGKRPDGYHELTSLVAPLEWGDRIRVAAREGSSGITLRSTGFAVPEGPENIAWKAAKRFLEAFNLSAAVEIEIEKRIPVGAGWGGGSSDAANVLLGLAELFDVTDPERVEALAVGLGSDCALFLRKGPVILRGRGERIEALDLKKSRELAGMEVALFKPCFGISSAWAYQALAACPQLYTENDAAEASLRDWISGASSLASLLMNSFDEVVGKKYPAIPLLLERVRQLGIDCLMSGSGSGCFALCEGGKMPLIEDEVRECWGKTAFFQRTRIRDI